MTEKRLSRPSQRPSSGGLPARGGESAEPLVDSALAAAGFPSQSGPKSKSRVVLVRDSRSLDDRQLPVPDVVSGMVNRAIVALTDEPAIPKAFEDVLGVSGVVLIKISHGVHEGILEPILRGLLTSGVSASNVVLYRKPKRGEQIGDNGLGAFASRYGVRFAEPKFTHGPESVGSTSFHLADVFYECDSIINVTLLGSTSSADVGAALASHAESIRETHVLRRNRSTAILRVNALPTIRTKTRLVICDALQPVFELPGTTSSHTWGYGAIVMARDPVALDSVSTTIVSRCRTHLGLDGAMRSTWTALGAAARLGLGNSERAFIDLVQIEV